MTLPLGVEKLKAATTPLHDWTPHHCTIAHPTTSLLHIPLLIPHPTIDIQAQIAHHHVAQLHTPPLHDCTPHHCTIEHLTIAWLNTSPLHNCTPQCCSIAHLPHHCTIGHLTIVQLHTPSSHDCNLTIARLHILSLSWHCEPSCCLNQSCSEITGIILYSWIEQRGQFSRNFNILQKSWQF